MNGALLRFVSTGLWGIPLEGTPDGIRPGAGDHVAVFRASLRRHEVVCSVYLIEVGAFEVASAGALPDTAAGGELLSGGDVDLALDYTTDTVVVRAVAHEVNMAVLLEQRRVDSALIDVYWLGPLAVDIVSPDVEVLVSGVVGGHHVEPAVYAADSRREYSAGAVDLVQHYLALPGEDIACLLPVHKVVALKKRHPREVLERTAYKIVFSIVLAHAGVGIKSGYDRVMVFHGDSSFLGIIFI